MSKRIKDDKVISNNLKGERKPLIEKTKLTQKNNICLTLLNKYYFFELI